MASFVVGVDIKTGEHVRYSKGSLYFVGESGTGKSTTLEHLLLQYIERGDGLCFLDPHGDSAHRILQCVPRHRLQDVIVWNPKDHQYPFGLNPFFVADPCDQLAVDRKTEDFLSTLQGLAEFAEVFRNAPQMTDVLRNLALAFILNGRYTLIETPEFLATPEFRRRFYAALDVPGRRNVLHFWQQYDRRPEREQRELVASSLNKLRRLQTTLILRTIFGQPTNSINFRQAMDSGAIIIVPLAGLGQGNGELIGAFIVQEIFQAALSRENIPEAQRRLFHLIADEFQSFSSTRFPELIAQARKYGADVVMANQYRQQLDAQNRAATLSIPNKIVFRVNGVDAAELATGFTLTPPAPRVTGQKPKYGPVADPLTYLRSHGHENQEVMNYYRQSITHIDRMIQELFAMRQEQEERVRVLGEGYAASPQELTLRRQRLEQAIGVYLHRQMVQGPGGVAREAVPESSTEAFIASEGACFVTYTYIPDDFELPIALYDGMMPNYIVATIRQLREQWEPLREAQRQHYRTQIRMYKEQGSVAANSWGVSNIGDRGATRFMSTLDANQYDKDVSLALRVASPWMHREILLAFKLRTLGLLLNQQPCLGPTGQLEPLYEAPRSYSDVQAQLANELATLPNYRARCSVLENGAPRECVIATLPPIAVPADGERVAYRLALTSRGRYGRDWQEVEAAIARRLRGSEHAHGPNGRERVDTMKGYGNPSSLSVSQDDDIIADEK